MRTSLTLLASALMLAFAAPADAVHLDPSGRGQVLIYPYYTVNNHQQTLLSVTNTSAAGQALKVRMKEGYNGRDVLDFNVWLAPYDMWTATVFALEDAGVAGEGAAILTSDTSCTSPQFIEAGSSLPGQPYVAFTNVSFSSANADGGPQGLSRTREGWIEIIAMTDVTAPLASAIAHTGANGAPADCLAVRPNSVIGTAAVSNVPSGGLIGTASIVNVAQGTLLATRAEGLGGFTAVPLFTGTDNLLPNLASVNDVFLAGAATARLFDDSGRQQRLSYGGPGVTASRPVDAVSAVLMADQLYNEFSVSAELAAGSDWVVTFPTKPFYTDPLFAGSNVRQPFETMFAAPGSSQIETRGFRFDRESRVWESGCCSFPTPPPGYYDPGKVRLPSAANILSFGTLTLQGSAVLGSRLATEQIPFPASDGGPRPDAGWLAMDLSGRTGSLVPSHSLSPSLEGKVLRGLPVVGFWAVNLVNNAVSNGVLSNYSAAVRHATSVTCVKASDGIACD